MASQIQDANEAALIEDMIRSGELSGDAAARAAADLKAFREAPPPEAPATLPGNADAANAPSSQADQNLLVRGVADAADAALTMGSGVVGNIAGGVAGAGRFAYDKFVNGMPAEKAVENAANTMDSVAQRVQWVPKTEDVTKAAQAVGELSDEYVQPVTQALDDVFYWASMGNPEVATALKTAVYGAPSLVGLKGMRLPARSLARMEVKGDKALAVNAAKAAAERSGLDLRNNEFHGSIVKTADTQFPQGDTGVLQPALRTARNNARDEVRTAYEQANTLGGKASVTPFKALHDDLRQTYELKNMDLQNMPMVKDILRDFKQIDRLRFDTLTRKLSKKKASEIELKNLAVMRERIGNAIGKAEGSEKAALQIAKNKFDNTLDDVFNSGAISGSKDALDAWKNARSLHAQWKKNFDANRTVRKLLDQDATPEMAYNWIVGASARGAKKEGAMVVKSLKKALGDQHPAIAEIRKAVSRDILRPILEQPDNPSWARGIVAINKLLKDNPSLVKELDLPVDDLVNLRKAMHAAKFVQMTPEKLITQPLITKALVRFIWGSGIAKAGAKVSILTKILDKVVDTGVMTPEKILAKMADDDEMFSRLPPLRGMPPRTPSNKALAAYAGMAELSQNDNQAGQY